MDIFKGQNALLEFSEHLGKQTWIVKSIWQILSGKRILNV